MDNVIRGLVDQIFYNEDDEKRPAKVYIDTEWYSTFKKELVNPFREGDYVEVEFFLAKGKFKNITRIEKISRGKKSTPKPDEKQKTLEDPKYVGIKFQIERMEKNLTQVKQVVEEIEIELKKIKEQKMNDKKTT